MNSLFGLWQRHPLILFHLVTAVSALALGIFILSRRKGTFGHRALGWTWVLLMGSTALATAFIHDYRLPNIGGYTPIHFFTLFVMVLLPYAIWQIRRGNVRAHRLAMKGVFIGGCLVAGIFTLLPGRFLGSLLWGTPLTGISA